MQRAEPLVSALHRLGEVGPVVAVGDPLAGHLARLVAVLEIELASDENRGAGVRKVFDGALNST